jgi:capsular exopolysaccharide synthesis family protein
MFRVPNNLGLSGYIGGACTLDSVLLRSHIPGLDLITSGPLPPNPAEFVGSWELATLLDELLGRYHFVLLDSPSCLAMVDALALAPRVDQVVLVVARGRASSEAIWSAREQLIAARARSIGVVVNRADPYDTTYAQHSRASVRT